jgi:hypothetical protein
MVVSRQELVLLAALWGAAGTLAYQQYDSASLDLLLWVIVLLVQSVPYLATVIVAVISAFPRLRAGLVCGRSCDEQYNTQESGT